MAVYILSEEIHDPNGDSVPDLALLEVLLSTTPTSCSYYPPSYFLFRFVSFDFGSFRFISFRSVSFHSYLIRSVILSVNSITEAGANVSSQDPITGHSLLHLFVIAFPTFVPDLLKMARRLKIELDLNLPYVAVIKDSGRGREMRKGD
jgi:hypothetical protein